MQQCCHRDVLLSLAAVPSSSYDEHSTFSTTRRATRGNVWPSQLPPSPARYPCRTKTVREKVADVSHPMKPWDLHERWTRLITGEDEEDVPVHYVAVHNDYDTCGVPTMLTTKASLVLRTPCPFPIPSQHETHTVSHLPPFVISEEFHRQGDLEAEKGVPVSPLCSREGHNQAKSQCDFVNFVVRPCAVRPRTG